jgi:NAD(P)-dependent dehydrogenase (short-subunit alcohol dehydrogenase family)
MTSHTSLSSAAELAATLLPSGLDILIVNGAYINRETAYLSPTDCTSPAQAQVLHDDMHASLDTNVLGVVYSINSFLPLVLKGSVKKIVAISTGMADAELSLDGVKVQVAYSSMKAALNMIVAKFAVELRPKGVMTLALCPGVVQTQETARRSQLFSYSFHFRRRCIG